MHSADMRHGEWRVWGALSEGVPPFFLLPVPSVLLPPVELDALVGVLRLPIKVLRGPPGRILHPPRQGLHLVAQAEQQGVERGLYRHLWHVQRRRRLSDTNDGGTGVSLTTPALPPPPFRNTNLAPVRAHQAIHVHHLRACGPRCPQKYPPIPPQQSASPRVPQARESSTHLFHQGLKARQRSHHPRQGKAEQRVQGRAGRVGEGGEGVREPTCGAQTGATA